MKRKWLNYWSQLSQDSKLTAHQKIGKKIDMNLYIYIHTHVKWKDKH